MTETRGRRRRSHLFIGLGVLAAAGLGWYLHSPGQSGPKFREQSVRRGNLDVTILATGVVISQNQVDIKAPIAGRVEKVLVKEGQRVRRGQVLAWMSSTERAALLDAARAQGPEEIKRWEAMYKATPILAPISGTIIVRNVESGQSFTSADAIFVESDRLIVRAQVDETDIAKVSVGQNANVVLDAYAEKSFAAKVDAIAYNAKTVNSVTTYEVDVFPTETPAYMRSGMTANITFRVDSRQDVVLIPSEAIRTLAGRRVVLVKKDDGVPEEREIDVGASDGRITEVKDGLEGRETVLILERRSGGRNGPGKNPFAPGGGQQKSRGGQRSAH